MQRITYEQLAYYRTDWDVTHGIFTRHGGVSPAPFASLNLGGTVGDEATCVRQNHERIYRALGVDGTRAVTVWMVHGVDVAVAEHPPTEQHWLAKADGIITNQPNLPLVMRYADCVPILYYDPVQRAIGMAHAGWRGTVNGIASATVTAMQHAYGSRSQDILTLIGPSISPARFQVGEEVVQALQDYFGTTEGMVNRDPHDYTAYVDLWEANRRDLARVGVQHIEIMGMCTVEHNNEFFSHRAEKGRTGRFGAVMSL